MKHCLVWCGRDGDACECRVLPSIHDRTETNTKLQEDLNEEVRRLLEVARKVT